MSAYPHTRVLRSDGKYINVILKTGHLFVCCKGCCCGIIERGHAPVPEALYHNEWERRKLRHRVHLTMSGCLGPCALSNVVMLLFDGTAIWFQSFNTEWQVIALYDYIEAMLQANALLPVPEVLQPFVFNFYAWQNQQYPLTSTLAPATTQQPTSIQKEQWVAPIIVLSHADTDLLTLERVSQRLPEDFPTVRGLSLEPLRKPEALEAFKRNELRDARLVLARTEGGLANAPQLQPIAEFCSKADRVFLCISAIGPDPQLDTLSTDPMIAREVYKYFQEGGPENLTQLLLFLSDHYFASGYGYAPPQPQPKMGVYHPVLGGHCEFRNWQDYATKSSCRNHCCVNSADETKPASEVPIIGVLFYRAHWMSGNTDFIDALVAEIEAQGAIALPLFVSSRNDLAALIEQHGLGDTQPLDVLIATTSFTLVSDVTARARFPILQAIPSGDTREHWLAAARGLGPLDTAMNIVLPEFDGRVITVPISFKRERRYQPDPERMTRKNQDNREHDLFNYDDYLQYHGGMIAAIRALSGKPPLAYFGDSSDPGRVRIRSLKEEAARVFRARVINPKWLQAMVRHGYKGGLEMAATVDYLFGYDATADVVEDWMYAEVAERYALDAETQAFLRRSNPWALREIAQRLLEAIQRGLWKADDAMRQRLLHLLATLSGDFEEFMDQAWLQSSQAAKQ